MTTAYITDEGKQAVINAQATGTAGVTLTEVAVIDASDNEVKRILLQGVNTISPHLIHVVFLDSSPDSYTAHKLYLYTDENVLFALIDNVNQAKSGASVFQASFELNISDAGEAAVLPSGDITLFAPPSTTEQRGTIETATLQEARNGEDNERALTPKGGREHGDIRYSHIDHLHDQRYAPIEHLHPQYLTSVPLRRAVYVNVSSTGNTGSANTARIWALNIHPDSGFSQNDHLIVRWKNSGSTYVGNGTSYWTRYYEGTFIKTTAGWILIYSRQV